MENNRTKGSLYEQKAADYLESAGYTILARNYRASRFEIDIIACEAETLVFVEVKYRADESFGNGLYAVDSRKRMRIRNAAREYLMRQKISEDTACRFDVISIVGEELNHIREAF